MLLSPTDRRTGGLIGQLHFTLVAPQQLDRRRCLTSVDDISITEALVHSFCDTVLRQAVDSTEKGDVPLAQQEAATSLDAPEII